MPAGLYPCQYKGCQSSPDQIAALRTRRPYGFPHDEDGTLNVCTVCRRLPLRAQGTVAAGVDMTVEPLDAAFIAGIKEELASIEESEKNIQALSQVFRYYAKHAKQLVVVLGDFALKQCFPWELIHALHLIDDILLMDKSGNYRTELEDRVRAVAVHAFCKVQSDQEKRELAKMLHSWRVLRIFGEASLEEISAVIRRDSPKAAHFLDEAAEDDDEIVPEPAAPSPPATTELPTATSGGKVSGEATDTPAAKKAESG